MIKLEKSKQEKCQLPPPPNPNFSSTPNFSDPPPSPGEVIKIYFPL